MGDDELVDGGSREPSAISDDAAREFVTRLRDEGCEVSERAAKDILMKVDIANVKNAVPEMSDECHRLLLAPMLIQKLTNHWLADLDSVVPWTFKKLSKKQLERLHKGRQKKNRRHIYKYHTRRPKAHAAFTKRGHGH